MIYGFIENDEITCKTNLLFAEDKNFYLAIDGSYDENFLNNVVREYSVNGINFIDKLPDFISIYLFDKKEKKLFLINDRIGAKRIYYYNTSKRFYFSNDLSYLKLKRKSINISVLSMYFRFHYIPEPYTIFNSVYKLEHGYYLKYWNSLIDKKEYYNVIDVFNSRIVNKDDSCIKESLDKKLSYIVKRETNHKSSFGLYLSSGVDSSLILSVLHDLGMKNINTFSIGFEYEKYNESNLSRHIANFFNTNHHELIINNKDALRYVNRIPMYYSEPFGDASALPTIILNEFAKKHGVKYAITGDGADQLFCGSNLYGTMKKISLFRTFNPIRLSSNSRINDNRKLFYVFSKVPKNYKAQIDVMYCERYLTNLFADNGSKRFDFECLINTRNLQEKRMIFDLNSFMKERVFQKMCVAANKNEINVISPYLTYDFIKYSFTIPHKYKYHHKIKKYIMRELLYSKIPREYFDRRKRGFGIPIAEWLKSELNADLKRLSRKSFIKKQGIFNYDSVINIINNIDNCKELVWDYYIFQIWYEHHFLKYTHQKVGK